ncbi:xanthine dehydrogenase family protein molybdopterin-binding subunit [Fulvivirga sp. M361]|uniref:xanthine dehydrogenase family protein molybdopterin-binding subunit n=1 Tax=Fulvivirga sp. M361 TaxID=2594266 RepID=UPI00117B5FE1|nr:xanthine dehydrogenase family protein molybdopterin-binding subunit [Fulvivirga sp. M361]TRX60077.1 xanthine dehydrogenase family protein molybdopterin-binding subunit [Fulvivirga sp. M361]
MDTKKIKMPYGISEDAITEVEREVPLNEPDAWPVNEKLKHVGKRVKRLDAYAKVTGEARYTSDIQLSGMLIGKMLISAHPNAKIRSIDTSAAEKLPGVYAVHVIKNEEEEAYPVVRYAGQPIAAAAAVTEAVAEEAVRLIKVDYDTRPFVVDIEKAMDPEAPVVYEAPVEQKASEGGEEIESGLKLTGNVRGPNEGRPRGELTSGFAEADIVVENTYRTQVQTHNALESHGMIVDWKPDGVTIYASTQGTQGVRNEFADLFDLPRSKVRVLVEFMGGGFGAKHGLGTHGAAAGHLAKKTGRPVKMMATRKEEQISQGNRPNSIHHLKVGVKKSGELTAIEQKSYGTAGVGLGAGVGGVAQSMYTCPNFKTAQYDVFTHAGPGAAWRAPGAVQGIFGLEQMMDELAEKIGIDPLAFRDKVDPSRVRKAGRKVGAERMDWSRRKPTGSDPGIIKKGIGMAQSSWWRIHSINATAEVKIFKDGAIEVRSGVQDIGTGTKTILAQVVAEEFGLEPEDIMVRIGDTLFPDAPGSGGSQVTASITPAARNAAYQAKLKLFNMVASNLETDVSDLKAADGYIFSSKDETKKMTFKEALKSMPVSQITATESRTKEYDGDYLHWDLGAVQFVELSVDTETGFIKIDKVVAAHSCGRPINITQLESQINGGIIQGISYAIYEDRILDRNTGHMVNHTLDTYKVPYAMDIPEIDIALMEDYNAKSSTDAYGIGEPSNIATAAAIANAVYNAIGVRIKEIPITPAKVLEALNKA